MWYPFLDCTEKGLGINWRKGGLMCVVLNIRPDCF